MGVQGLWKLLAPAGRRIKLETLENRVLAIDVSIWLLKMIHGYLALGNEEHRNIHLTGIFRRIVKLLYYGIKPVFVFDGKFPELKRETVRKRQEFRERRKTNLKKVAEKFLSKVLEDRLKETVGRLTQQKKPVSHSPKRGSTREDLEQEEEEDKMFNDDAQVFDYEFDYIVDENKEALIADGIDLEEFYLQDSEAQYETIKKVKNKMRDRKIKKYLEIDSLDDLSKVHVRDYVNHIQRKNKIEKTREENCAKRLTHEQEMVMGNSNFKEMFKSNYMKTFFTDPKKQVVQGTLASDRTKGFMYLTQANEKYDTQVLKVEKKRGSKNEKLKKLSAQLRDIAQNAENGPQFFSFEELLCDNPLEAFKHSNLAANGDSPIRKSNLVRPSTFQSDKKVQEEARTNVDVDDVFGFDDWDKKAEEGGDKKEGGVFEQEDKEGSSSNLEDLFEFNVEDCRKKSTELVAEKIEEVVKIEDNKEVFVMSQESGRGLDDIKSKIAKLKEEIMEEKLEKAKQREDEWFEEKRKVVNLSKKKSEKEEELEKKKALKELEEVYYEPEEKVKEREQEFMRSQEKSVRVPVQIVGEEKPVVLVKARRSEEEEVGGDGDELRSVSSSKEKRREDELEVEVGKEEEKLEDNQEEVNQNEEGQAGWFKRMMKEDDGILEIEDAEEIGEIAKSKDVEEKKKEVKKSVEKERVSYGTDYMEEFDFMDLDEDKLVQEMKDLEDAENLDKWTLMQEFQKFQNLSEFEAGSIQEKFNEIKELLVLFGIPWVDSPTEAEAQCSFLEENGLVDGIVTDDSDAFLFGGKHIYRNIFEKGDFAHSYRMGYIEHDMALDRQKLILLALFLGSDYTLGIRGVGIVNAIEIVTAFDTEEALKRFKDWAEVPDVLLENASEHYRNVPQKELDYKLYHRNFKKHWELPDNFPDERVIDAYKHPNVDQSLEKFQWGQPDFASLKRYCETRLKWDEARIYNLLEPLKNAISERGNQTKITDFFKEEKIATINSKRITDAIKNLKAKENDDFHMPATITKSIDNIIEKQNPRNIKKRETGDYANEMRKHFAFDKKRVKKL